MAIILLVFRLESMRHDDAFFITGTAYAGKSTMIKLLAEKYGGILYEENYHDQLLPKQDKTDYPYLCGVFLKGQIAKNSSYIS